MKRFAVIAATCLIGFALTACDKGNKTEVKTQPAPAQTDVKDTGTKNDNKGMDTTQPTDTKNQ